METTDKYVKLSDVEDLLRLIAIKDMYNEWTPAYETKNAEIKVALAELLDSAKTKEDLR